MRRWKKIFHANGNDKKAGVIILISDKIDFKTKAIQKDKKGHYIIIKGSINTRGYYTRQYICTQYRSTQIHKTNTNPHKGRNDGNIIIVGGPP